MLNIVVVRPIPSVSASVATSVRPGLLSRLRSPYRTSRRSDCMPGGTACERTRFQAVLEPSENAQNLTSRCSGARCGGVLRGGARCRSGAHQPGCGADALRDRPRARETLDEQIPAVPWNRTGAARSDFRFDPWVPRVTEP